MDLKLKGKTAFVAGSSRGLGYAVARGLLMEGCKVAINARNPASLEAAANKLREETGGEVVPLEGDVADPAVPAKLINSTVNTLGSLDLLVTNAGGPPAGQFESIEDETWQKAIELSLMSHVRLIRAALSYLKASEIGSVLTVTSYSVKQPIPNLVLSNSIRAATVGLTKTLALEVGNAGIRFNSILPGWTDTERVFELMSARANQNGTSVEAEIARQMKESPIGRMATPEEFANAAVFLLSPAAAYITGVMLSVDGGMVKGTF
jgi:3-oxoacyl-[acyl-carrier protein] reductase